VSGFTEGPVRTAPATGPVEVRPNPFQHGTSLRLDVNRAGQASVRIHDRDGHLVRTVLSESSLHAGSYTFWWNGRDQHGEPVVPGEYDVRAVIGDADCTERIVRLR